MFEYYSSANKYVLKGIEHIQFILNIHVPMQRLEIQTITSIIFNLFGW